MRRSFSIITALICAGLCGGLLLGGTPNLKDVERSRTDAEKSQIQADKCKAAAEQATGDLKAANQAASDAYHSLAESQGKLATAFAAGEDTKALSAQNSALNDAVSRAVELVTIRKAQSVLNGKLTDAEQAALLKLTADVNKPLANDLIGARRKGVEAAEKLAVLLATPGVSNNDLDAARDENFQAIDTIDMAGVTLQINTENYNFFMRPGGSDPALATQMADLAKIEQDYLAAFKSSKDQAILVRQLQRKLTAERSDILRDLPKPPPTPPAPVSKPEPAKATPPPPPKKAKPAKH